MATKSNKQEPARQVDETHQEASRLHPPSGPVPPPLRRDRHSSEKTNVASTPPAALRGGEASSNE